jgi:hypothetical protein
MRLEVTIPDRLFNQAMHVAAENGFDSLAAYVVELISHDVEPEASDDYDHAFTPQVLAALDTAAAEARAGESYTRKEVDEFLANNRAAWLANHPS